MCFSTYRPTQDPEQIHLKRVDDSSVILTSHKFLNAIHFKILEKTIFKTHSNEDVIRALYKHGYQAKLKGVGDFKRENYQLFGSSYTTTSFVSFQVEPVVQTLWKIKSWKCYGVFSTVN